jgi:hypothetical protein
MPIESPNQPAMSPSSIAGAIRFPGYLTGNVTILTAKFPNETIGSDQVLLIALW